MKTVLTDTLYEAINFSRRVATYTHNFYNYPARFSPEFVNYMLVNFSNSGDVILDPFLGGGTTLVEALALGRKGIGLDVNSLSTFVSRVKTTMLNNYEIEEVESWKNSIDSNGLTDVDCEINHVTFNNNPLNDKDIWQVKKLIELIFDSINEMKSPKASDFARCALLRTSQWALENRFVIPTVTEFRNYLTLKVGSMLEQLIEYSDVVLSTNKSIDILSPIILKRNIIGVEEEPYFRSVKPDLIITSPPYPGVHILYHRWQIRSRKETSLPYWIISESDGNPGAYYTLGDRKSPKKYFTNIEKAFTSIGKICKPNTLVIQLIAFSSIDEQLPQYLSAMNNAGFVEDYLSAEISTERIWRKVPNRKWYTNIQNRGDSSMELVLTHRYKG